MKKVINVVGAVIYSDNKILCAQRSENMSLRYYGNFLVGRLKKGKQKKKR